VDNSMCARLVLLAVVVGIACALGEEANDTPVFSAEMAMLQVQQEEAIARAYLGAVLKLQHAMYTSTAASNFIQENPIKAATSFLEVDENDFEEHGDDLDQDFDEDTTTAYSPNPKQRLTATYNLFRAIIVKTYQIIFGAAQVQQEFYVDRMMQIGVQASGQQVPPQVLQLVYMKLYTSMLKTWKFSYALQTVSHFRTWLEDEIDVGTAVVSRSANFEVVVQDQEDDLIRDRLFAFQSYNMQTMLDLQLTYFEMYLQQAFQALIGPAANATQAAGASSFLEEEATAQPSGSGAGAQFWPMMMSQNPMMMTYMFKFWRVMLEFSAARSGLSAAYAEQQSYDKLHDSDPSNDVDALKLKEYSRSSFGGFAQNLLMSSQLEYITAIYEMYAMYAPAMGQAAGSF